MKNTVFRYPLAALVVLSLPFFLFPGWEVTKFLVLASLVTGYTYLDYRNSSDVASTERALDAIAGIVGVIAAFFAILDYKVISFERDVANLSAEVDDDLAWIILNLEDFDEFCLQCVQSRDTDQCAGYFRTSANRVDLTSDPEDPSFRHDAHLEECNRYKHFRLQMEMQIRQPYLVGTHRSPWRGNLCETPGLEGASKDRMCRIAAEYDTSIEARDAVIASEWWYDAAERIRSIKGFNWILFLSVFSGIKLAKGIFRWQTPAM